MQKLVKLKKQYLGDIDISNIKDLSFLFEDVDRNDFAGIENWDTSKVEDMHSLFRTFDFTAKNVDISAWDTSKVESMRGMFQYQYNNSFNQNINTWNTGKVKDMSGMFCAAKAFNQPIGARNTKKATNMHYYVWSCFKFLP